MKATIIALLLCIAAPTMAADDSWKDVEVTANLKDMIHCTYIKDVEATGTSLSGMPSADKHAGKLALKRLIILTDRAGGDSLYVTEIQVENGRARMTGMALDCWADR